MKFTTGLLAILSTITISACSHEPCDEVALKKYSKILIEKMPLMAELENEKQAVVVAKFLELNNMENVPKDELCILVKQLLDEVETALAP